MSASAVVADAGNDVQDITLAKRGCCFWIPCFRSESSPSSSSLSSYGSGWWEQMRAPENKERWWVRGWKKMRAWSEIVSGPKWKTFIRRLNRGRNISYTKMGSFQYDPLSYTRNFDNGTGHNGDDDYGYADFSARLASVPASAKSSMDLGKDAPSFT